jgi:hypothetical protein
MPQDKQDKDERQRQGNKENFDRHPQRDEAKTGSKGSAMVEREGKPVSNDIDRQFDDSDDDEEVTQRNPRMGDREGE